MRSPALYQAAWRVSDGLCQQRLYFSLAGDILFVGDSHGGLHSYSLNGD
jgi:hypothetical protein